VLDLRTLLPLDREAILATARKTGKVLVVHEDRLTGGIGGEVAGIITQEAVEYLDGIGMDRVRAHERALMSEAQQRLAVIEGLPIY